MADLVYKAIAEVTIRVSAPDDARGRFLILEHLQDADTDFIRSNHWDRRVVAEFRLTTLDEVSADGQA